VLVECGFLFFSLVFEGGLGWVVGGGSAPVTC
jgi:hypothetical protein